MKRKLIQQMCREWKTNIWLIVELVIVILILQVILGSLCLFGDMHSYSTGKPLKDVYVSNISRLEEDSEGYIPYDSLHTMQTDMEMLMTQLRANPYVEHVASGSYNSLPYSYNFYGQQYYYRDRHGAKSRTVTVNNRSMSPEMLEVLQIHGVNGETPAQLADILRRGDVIMADADEGFADDQPKVSEFLGKDTYEQGDSLKIIHVGAIAQGMRRNDYEPQRSGTLYNSILPGWESCIAVRVKPGTGHKFQESLSDKDTQAGNLYIMTPMTSINDMRDSAQLEINQQIRNFIICALFLMLVIFLGFLGTFWFRTQQRVPEIAIRKVNGATNRDIYARFFGESLILLAVAVLVTLPISLWLIFGEPGDSIEIIPYMGHKSLVMGLIITIVLMVLLIIGSVYAPARRATRIDPASALKEM